MPRAIHQVDNVVETSEMARQNGKELSYPWHRQGLVCVDVYGRFCGSIVANKLASLWRGIDSAIRTEKSFNRGTCYHVLEFFL